MAQWLRQHGGQRWRSRLGAQQNHPVLLPPETSRVEEEGKGEGDTAWGSIRTSWRSGRGLCSALVAVLRPVNRGDVEQREEEGEGALFGTLGVRRNRGMEIAEKKLRGLMSKNMLFIHLRVTNVPCSFSHNTYTKYRLIQLILF